MAKGIPPKSAVSRRSTNPRENAFYAINQVTWPATAKSESHRFKQCSSRPRKQHFSGVCKLSTRTVLPQFDGACDSKRPTSAISSAPQRRGNAPLRGRTNTGLTVDDLNAISTSEIASRCGGHLLLMREADPNSADAADVAFPPLMPSVQGEKCGVSTRPCADFVLSVPALRPLSMALPSVAQTAETDDVVASLHDPICVQLYQVIHDHVKT